MLTFIHFGYSRNRRRLASTEPNASTELKGANVLTGLHAVVWMLSAGRDVAAMAIVLIGIRIGTSGS